MPSGMRARLGAAPPAPQARALHARAPRPGGRALQTTVERQCAQEQSRRPGPPPAALPPAAAAAQAEAACAQEAAPAAAASGPPPPPAAPPQLPRKAGGTLAESKMYRTRPQDEGRLVSEFGYSAWGKSRYDLGEKIGKGAHATVHVATDRETGERVAVKVMPKQLGPNGFLEPHFVRRVRNEVDIATHLCGSLNVCYFHGAYETDAAVYLVLELLSGGPLWDRINSKSYGERAAARLVREVLRTVAQCHSKGIMMRDIKPHNFMFATPDEDSPLKAVDFGISVFCRPGEVIRQRAGTRIVMSPEVVRGRYGLKADLWSVGITTYLLLTGRLPFPFWDRLYVQKKTVTAEEMYHEILEAPLDFASPPWDTLSGDARDLVQQLLERDEERRPTAKEALQHRWLQDAEDAAGSQDVPLSRGIVQRLQRFGTYSRLKQVALRTVANHIPLDSTTIADLRGVFLELDPSDSGRVPYTRLQQALEDGTYTVSSAEARQLLGQLELEEDGAITFAEWVAALMDWSKMYESSDWDALVERAFHAIDKDGSGTLTPDEWELVLCGEEGCEAPDDLDAAMREADLLEAEGGISLEQFRALLAGELGDRLDLFETRLPGNTMDTMDSTSTMDCDAA